ncbi:MAG: hypothetical protein K1X91_02040, partial [Bacteriodetes bacterium]|nr:hypothetical protein [Bacteroidota bacterium]
MKKSVFLSIAFFTLLMISCNTTTNTVITEKIPTISYVKTFGGSGNDIMKKNEILSDGSTLLLSSSSSIDGDCVGNHGSSDICIIKLDNSNNILWRKMIGGSLDELSYDFATTSDGGCVVLGTTNSINGDISINKGKKDIVVVKL